jgi:hypothetical protein
LVVQVHLGEVVLEYWIEKWSLEATVVPVVKVFEV